MPWAGTTVASERHQEILRLALQERSLRIRDLAVHLDVHEVTVRRDLDQMAEGGLLERTHGGARLVERTTEELSYSLRATQQTNEKDRIARAALSLIQDGDAIALDASTTSLTLARLLPARDVLVFITSLDAAEILAASGVRFVLLGGEFHAPARSFVGSFFHQTMSRINLDKVFFSSKGFTGEEGFTDVHLPEIEVKIALIKSGAMKVALLDHTKFGIRSLATIATTNDVDVLVTDKAPDPEVRRALDIDNVRLLVATSLPPFKIHDRS